MTAILVRRTASWQGRVRAFKILVDGREVATIDHDSERRIDVGPGRHVLQAKVDWCSSPPLETTVREGETKIVELGPNATVWTTLYYVVLKPGHYLWMREKPAAV